MATWEIAPPKARDAARGHGRAPRQTPSQLRKGAALERAGDLAGALAAYEEALRQAPEDLAVLSALAELASTLEMPEAAERFWAEVSRLAPDRLEAVDGRARALREMGAFDEAVGLLREALLSHPDEARLWNSLGVTLIQDSQPRAALTFLDKAVELNPRDAVAVYNRAQARFDLSELDLAAEDFERARVLARKPSHATMAAFAAATLALARGDLVAGWEGYEMRLSRHWPGAPAFNIPGRRWTPGAPLNGRHLLVVGEQGLGDEIMFANLIADLIGAVGVEGRLSVATDPRLVALFQRSFPQAFISAHATTQLGARRRRSAPDLDRERPVDVWAPMASLPRQFRQRLADFPADLGGYLRPDQDRVAHWRRWLGDGPPSVGVSWRSGKVLGDRRRQYPPRDLWTEVLLTSGVRFVNLQYGDCADELAAFRAAGAEVIQPPGIDLKADLDDLAALCCALDQVVCVANATAALAGASGANLALIGAPASWPRLGTPAYPWYPKARALTAPAFGDWAAAMAQTAELVRRLVT